MGRKSIGRKKMSRLTVYDAISLVKRLYEKAVTLEYVQKPISWALYQTWKEFDKREMVREREESRREENAEN